MPDPFPQFRKVGLLDSLELPTESQYKVLDHLSQEGGPRLYLQEVGNLHRRASVSNTAHEAGRSTFCDVEKFVNKRWVELDEALRRKAAQSIEVYKISKQGLEILAQYRANRRYRKETVELARRILKEEREKFQALKPKKV